jgi:two-component system, OmpR family, sensor histidine kinase KdpD
MYSKRMIVQRGADERSADGSGRVLAWPGSQTRAPASDCHGPLLTARARGGRVELRVADHGPGIPAADRDKMFIPFQRLGDTDPATGVGLGLAVSRGLIEAMRGTLEPKQTPGGGLSMTMSLPAAVRPGPSPPSLTDLAGPCPDRHPVSARA